MLLALFVFSYEMAVWEPGRRPTATGPGASLAASDSLAAADPPLPAQPTAPTASAGPVEPEPPNPRPVFERGSPAARRLRLVRRYVGTVGSQPATALLDWQNPDSVSGTFYLHRWGPAYRLTLPNSTAPPPHRHQGQVLDLTAQLWEGGGWWQLHGRPGATLRATWYDGPTGRPQAVVLRENYAGAVRLAVQTEWVRGPYYHSAVPAVRYDFMHLPDPAAVPPALRPILSPGPATRHHRLLTSGDYDCVTSYQLTVHLNEAGLFSYRYWEECSPIAGTYSGSYHNALLDLRGGRWLAPESQLVPNYHDALARLLAPHLLHDQAHWQINRDSTWRQQLAPYLTGARPDTLAATTYWLLANAELSAAEGLFTGAGLEIEMSREPYVGRSLGNTFTFFFPYAELRPLVRPGTPLARMLRARGLWQAPTSLQ